jgi:hypothetical protein
MYTIQHCFICRPSDSTVPEDAGIEPRTSWDRTQDNTGIEPRITGIEPRTTLGSNPGLLGSNPGEARVETRLYQLQWKDGHPHIYLKKKNQWSTISKWQLEDKPLIICRRAKYVELPSQAEMTIGKSDIEGQDEKQQKWKRERGKMCGGGAVREPLTYPAWCLCLSALSLWTYVTSPPHAPVRESRLNHAPKGGGAGVCHDPVCAMSFILVPTLLINLHIVIIDLKMWKIGFFFIFVKYYYITFYYTLMFFSYVCRSFVMGNF